MTLADLSGHDAGRFEIGQGIDPARPTVIARCLEPVAPPVEGMSEIFWEINRRNPR